MVGAARVDRALGLDRLAAVEHQRVLAHRDDLGAEPVLLGLERGDHRAVDLGGAEAAIFDVQLAAEAREGDVEARPAVDRERPDQLGAVLAELGVGEAAIAFAAERLALLDDQQRHVGAVARHGERGEAAGQPPAGDQDSVPPAPRHSAPP